MHDVKSKHIMSSYTFDNQATVIYVWLAASAYTECISIISFLFYMARIQEIVNIVICFVLHERNQTAFKVALETT